MTTRPGCESSSPHPAAAAQSLRGEQEAAGGGQAPHAFAPRSHVTSVGPGRKAGGRAPHVQAKGSAGQVGVEAVRGAAPAASVHPACISQAPCPHQRSHGEGRGGGAVEAETARRALTQGTGSCLCSAQRDLLPLRLHKEQGSRALLSGRS